METKILSTKNDDIELAGKILEAGGLVAFPTETVYGLGANALNENSVKNIYKAKGRPSDNPLIVHIAKKEDIIPLVKEVTPKAQALIDTFFPGALTIILPKSELVGNVVSGGLDTVAVRMPANEIAHRVIEAAHCPIAAPSANTPAYRRLQGQSMLLMIWRVRLMRLLTAAIANTGWNQPLSPLQAMCLLFCAPVQLQKKCLKM